MSTIYRAGIIGSTGKGDYGHSLDTAYQDMPNVQVIAVADPDPDGRKAAGERTGAEKLYSDYREMLERETLDLVNVCPRWANEHANMVIACAQAGVKGIFCEKPFAQTLAEADAMIEACEGHGTKVAVAHRRASPYEQHTKRLLDEGLIGDVQMIRRHGLADHRAGAMDMLVLGPHLVDNIRFFAGSEVAWAFGHVTQDGQEVALGDVREGEEGVGLIAGNGLSVYFAFENGVIAHCGSHSGDVADRPDKYDWLGVEIHGSKGILSLRCTPLAELYHYPKRLWLPGDREANWERIVLPEWDQKPDGRPRSIQEMMHLSNQMIVSELIQAIEEDRDVTAATSDKDARAVLEMITAIHESHRLQARVHFPLENRENPYVVWRDEGGK